MVLRKIVVIYIYIINWLLFITATECVYCAARTKTLSIIQANYRL